MPIPTPHTPDDDQPPPLGDKVEKVIAEPGEWERIPGKPGIWRNRRTGRLIYIPSDPNIRQVPD